MSWNGSGLFNIDSTGQPVSANTLIESADFNALTADLATGLSNCITKDGQQTVTANLPMATYRHTGVGNAVARTDYAAAGQVQDGKLNWVDGGGTADAITATYSPAITALVDGQMCCVRATAANATTTPTFSPNGLTARTIVKKGGAALVAGDIVADGHELILRYDLANTRWELMNPVISINDSPQFAGINLGHASDTTLTRASAGVVAVEGVNVVLAGSVTTDGITMSTARLLGRTTASTGAVEEITVGSGLSLSAGSLTSTGGVLTSGTVVDTSTGATSYTVTGLPANAKFISFGFGGISTNGTSSVMLRIGPSGGVVSTGYVGGMFDGTTNTTPTDGAYLHSYGAAAAVFHGRGTLQLIDASTNTWSWSFLINVSDSNRAFRASDGTISLSGALERFQLIANGTDTFDAGKLNYLVWE